MEETFEQLRVRLNLLSLEAFSELPTPRKMAFYKKYRGMRWMGKCGCCGEVLYSNNEEKQRYEDAGVYMDNLKSILDKCEHVER